MGEETKSALHDITAINRGLENPQNSPPKRSCKFLWLCILVSAGFEIVVNAQFDSMISSGQDEMICYLIVLIHHLFASLGIIGHIYKLRTLSYDQEIKALERLLREKEAESQQDVKNAAKKYEGEQERLYEKISMLDWLWRLNYIIDTTNLLVLTKDWNSKMTRALERTCSKVPGRANKALVTHVIDLTKTHRKRNLYKILLSEKMFTILEDYHGGDEDEALFRQTIANILDRADNNGVINIPPNDELGGNVTLGVVQHRITRLKDTHRQWERCAIMREEQ